MIGALVRPVLYLSFAKRSMTSSMDLNMQRNPRARRLASERTLTHGLGQDNQSRAGARRVRGRGRRERTSPALRTTDCTGGCVFFRGREGAPVSSRLACPGAPLPPPSPPPAAAFRAPLPLLPPP